MSEMVKRLAAAMEVAGNKWVDGGQGRDWRDVDLDVLARAALEAMREPTEEMMVAAENAFPLLMTFADKEESGSYITWRAMIDETLALSSDHRGTP